MSEIGFGIAWVVGATGVIGAGVSYGTRAIESMFDKSRVDEPLVLPPPPPSIESAHPISDSH